MLSNNVSNELPSKTELLDLKQHFIHTLVTRQMPVIPEQDKVYAKELEKFVKDNKATLLDIAKLIVAIHS